jgi:hypothetical protein
LNKVGDSSVSPYLLQRLRSIDEVADDRGQRRRGLDTQPQQNPPTAKVAARDDSSGTNGEPGEKQAGQRVDRSI